jgi:hypothetical protein
MNLAQATDTQPYLKLTQLVNELEAARRLSRVAASCIRHAADALLFAEDDATVAIAEAQLTLGSLREHRILLGSEVTRIERLLEQVTAL